MPRHLLTIRNMPVDQIEHLLGSAKDLKKRVAESRPLPDLSHHVLGLVFFENSTRTRVSFEQAARYLSMRFANFAGSASSMSKGETLKDTIITLRHERLCGLVMRHGMSGSAQLAARYFGGPILNAGDGRHEHPTQALGDAFTVLERRNSIKGLRIAIVGDVAHSRVARSNAWMFHKLGAEVRFVGPRTLMPSPYAKLPGLIYYDLQSGIEDADVVMCLRLQRERMDQGLIGSLNEYARLYQINRETLSWASKDCLVMHPGPLNRGVEVDDIAADGEKSCITAQVENGVFVRMAALNWIFGEEPVTKASQPPKSARQTKRVSK